MRHKFSDDDFIDAIKSSFSISGTLIKLGLSPTGGGYKSFHIRVKNLNIDTSHFTGEAHLKGKTHSWSPRITLDELLVINSNKAFHSSFKQRLINENLLINHCYKCGLKDFWNDEPIVLQIDHINGDHFDHRIENLRLLCPNCHSQTATFCSKNYNGNSPKIKKSEYKQVEKKNCIYCSKPLKSNRYDSHKVCYNLSRPKKNRPSKIEWPSIEDLLSKLKYMNYMELGKVLGVSDNAIRKHLKKQ